MNKKQLLNFITLVTAQILEAGEMAVKAQGRVSNLKKEIKSDKNTSQRIIDRSQAKTEIDERVQEMLLLSVKEIFGTNGVRIDAEEDTPLKSLFNNKASLTIIIDPIDGTLEYLNGSDEYSINLGVIENGEVLTAIIYYPKLKKMYYLDLDKKSYEIIYGENLKVISKEEIVSPKVTKSKTIYTNNRVSEELINNLTNKGFTVIKDGGVVSWPEALLKCISGEFSGVILHTPQVRDILFGAMIENLSGGFKVDWEGKDIDWPREVRIPRVVLGVGKFSAEFFEILNEKLD